MLLPHILTSVYVATTMAASSKRGIIGVDNVHSFGDHAAIMAGNVTNWAYNYGVQPGNASWFGTLDYVPQLWGGNDAASFQSQVLANTPVPSHILTFNEPDGGGSGQATMTPAFAATLWMQYVEPLRAHNIKLGSPACTGSDGGIQWLREFMGNCTSCHVDFLATHWYGSYQGLASHLGNMYATFNGTTMWVTELGIDSASVQESQDMFNQSIPWLDSLSWVERYAWFGAFRSSDSNVGPNATFLNAAGGYTPLGTEYLFDAPANATSTSTTTSTTTTTPRTAGSSSAAATQKASAGAAYAVSYATLFSAVLVTMMMTLLLPVY